MRKRDPFEVYACREMSASLPLLGDALREVDLDAMADEIMGFPPKERPLSVRKGWRGQSADERRHMRDRIKRGIEGSCGDFLRESESPWFVLPRWGFSLTGCAGSVSCRVGAVFADPSNGVSRALPCFDGAHRERVRDQKGEGRWRSVLSYRIWLDTSWSMQDRCALLADALRSSMFAASLLASSDVLQAGGWRDRSFARRGTRASPAQPVSSDVGGSTRGLGREYRLLQEERVADLEAWSECDFEWRFAALRRMLA